MSLCKKCKDLLGAGTVPVWLPGPARGCGHEVNPVDIFQWCEACAAAKNVCAVCGENLPAETQLHLAENGWIRDFLLSQPESGMGYQQVELHLRDGRIISNLIVLNAEIIQLPDQYKDVTEEDILKIAVLWNCL